MMVCCNAAFVGQHHLLHGQGCQVAFDCKQNGKGDSTQPPHGTCHVDCWTAGDHNSYKQLEVRRSASYNFMLCWSRMTDAVRQPSPHTCWP